MKKIAVYNQDNGVPALMIFTEEALKQNNILALSIKYVPAGKKFKIISETDVPNEKQETWVVSESDLTDGIGTYRPINLQ